jgi:hypothetical protein
VAIGDGISIPHFNNLTAREHVERNVYVFKVPAIILMIDEARGTGGDAIQRINVEMKRRMMAAFSSRSSTAANPGCLLRKDVPGLSQARE